jgi:hypothetical protein
LSNAIVSGGILLFRAPTTHWDALRLHMIV